MALDRAVQLAHANGTSPPTLRLYGWARPTLTLGRFQHTASVCLDQCRESGVDVVRRFTGGRGVLHDDEVTYSIVAGVADGVPRSTAASYRMLCGALVRAYSCLGVPAELTARPRGRRDSAACYLHATHADLSLGARKLSGSAQVWLQETVLQHGSIVLSRDIGLEGRILGLTADDERALDAATITLAGAIGEPPSSDQVRTALIGGVTGALGVLLEPGSYSPWELECARGLLGEVAMQGDRGPGPCGDTSIRVE
jgi:lipoate-protein ligase A